MMEIDQTKIVSEENKIKLVQKNDEIKNNLKVIQFNLQEQIKWWISKKNNSTSMADYVNPVENKKKNIINPLKKIEGNKCKTCGKITRPGLPYCSTDCTYWPHLRKKVIRNS